MKASIIQSKYYRWNQFNIARDIEEPTLIKRNSMVYMSRRGSGFGKWHPIVSNSVPRSNITNKAN